MSNVKQATIYGLTESTITFNVLGGTLVGKAVRTVDLTNSNKEEEIRELVGAGLIEVEYSDEAEEQEHVESTLAVNVRSKEFPQPVYQTVKNPIEFTERTGSEAVIVTDKGVKKGRARRSYVPDHQRRSVSEMEQKIRKGAQESLDAMRDLEREEEESIVNMNDRPDDSHLDRSERMGEKAVIGTGDGTNKEVELKPSALTEQNDIREADPFVDREEKAEKEALLLTQEAFVDSDTGIDQGEEEHSEAFIEK